MSDARKVFPFGCPLCGDEAYGNTRDDPAAMLCRDCHNEYIWSECATVEETLARMGYAVVDVPQLAADMRALFAVRGDRERVDEICSAISLRNERECEARELAIRALHAFGDAIANCAIAEMHAENATAEMRGRCCRAAKAVAEELERTDSEAARGARLAFEAVFDAAHGPRLRMHQRLHWLASGDEREQVAPMPARVVAWVREWIDTAPFEELRRWHMGWSMDEPGVRFEWVDRDRDDSVTITERSFAYHLLSREERADPAAKGVWCEVAFDPPHELIEWLPSREESEP